MEPVLTPHGLQKLQEEIEELKNRRSGIATRLQRAKDLGDLSENAEYQEAKDEQAFVEGKILELEDMLHRATVVTPTHRRDVVGFGSTVRVNLDGKEKSFSIVGSNEANPQDGKISSDSPLGAVLLGKKVGDTVVLTVPKGTLRYTISEIS